MLVFTLKNPRIPTLLKVAVKFICIKQGVFSLQLYK